ncbi:hypothetical protein LguiA_010507 [Lonicera macranthoides]
MEFCPTCGILLQYALPHMGHPSRFFCPTCSYICHIESKVKIKRRQHLVKKEIEPIFSKDELKNGPTTEASCPNCGYDKASFQQIQIRSADEPMTTFYKCLNESCENLWRED